MEGGRAGRAFRAYVENAWTGWGFVGSAKEDDDGGGDGSDFSEGKGIVLALGVSCETDMTFPCSHSRSVLDRLRGQSSRRWEAWCCGSSTWQLNLSRSKELATSTADSSRIVKSNRQVERPLFLARCFERSVAAAMHGPNVAMESSVQGSAAKQCVCGPAVFFRLSDTFRRCSVAAVERPR